MSDEEKSVAKLTNSFSFIAEKVSRLTTLSDNQAELDKFKSEAHEIHSSIINSIVALQFYDRLSQRLDHVERDPCCLSDPVSDPGTANNPEAWDKLQSDRKSNYSVEGEKLMFEHTMNGASVSETLEIYHHHFEQAAQKDDDNDEVELF